MSSFVCEKSVCLAIGVQQSLQTAHAHILQLKILIDAVV